MSTYEERIPSVDALLRSAQTAVVTVRRVPAEEASHLPIEQRIRAAIAIFDAQASLLKQGWDLESVLRTAWTVEFQTDGACKAEPVSTAPAGPGLPSRDSRVLDSSFDWHGRSEALEVEVRLSRTALARLVAGEKSR